MSTVKYRVSCCLRLGKASLIHCQEMSLPGGGIHLKVRLDQGGVHLAMATIEKKNSKLKKN